MHGGFIKDTKGFIAGLQETEKVQQVRASVALMEAIFGSHFLLEVGMTGRYLSWPGAARRRASAEVHHGAPRQSGDSDNREL